ncbi:hypothetical protein E2C01_022715 [Portunus trituberculatus]|uniref:Uncharacterized protein n=1 Tax=Portunus trituberculatus TaxID=210409 RepID=A0A5B7E641_PORTR|nr:hypothetical protein [Portunus trituberculatus]
MVNVAAVTCGAFSVDLQGAARADWARRTCELVVVSSKETLFDDNPFYRCYVYYNKTISASVTTITSRATKTPRFTTTTTRSPNLNTTLRHNTTAARPTTATTTTSNNTTVTTTTTSNNTTAARPTTVTTSTTSNNTSAGRPTTVTTTTTSNNTAATRRTIVTTTSLTTVRTVAPRYNTNISANMNHNYF